jgi:hypothetical protein
VAAPSIQLWILGVAGGCFVAGMFFGHAYATRASAAATAPSEVQAYADDLIARYRLDGAQSRSLRIVLQSYQAEEESIRRTVEWSQLPASLQSRWLAVSGRTRQRIRALLDDEQRAAYDRDSQPARLAIPEAKR